MELCLLRSESFDICMNFIVYTLSFCCLHAISNKLLFAQRLEVMGDSSQFSPLTTLSEQLGPNSWVSSVFIPAFIANIGKHFFLKYD